MNPVRAAIYTRLSGDAVLTGLLSAPDAIYHRTIPQTGGFPAVVFSRQSGTPGWQFAGAHIQDDVWLVKAVSRGSSASPAEDIAARIDAVLTDAPLAVTGRLLLAVYRQSDVDYDEVDAGERYHHVGSQYRLVTQPA